MQTLKLCAKCAEKLSRGYAVNKEPATSAKGKCAECGKTGYMSEYTVTKK